VSFEPLERNWLIEQIVAVGSGGVGVHSDVVTSKRSVGVIDDSRLANVFVLTFVMDVVTKAVDIVAEATCLIDFDLVGELRASLLQFDLQPFGAGANTCWVGEADLVLAVHALNLEFAAERNTRSLHLSWKHESHRSRSACPGGHQIGY
jgi:hypothetical protein